MYWCKLKPKTITALIGSFILAICITACKPDLKGHGALTYFDINGYFTKEAARLAKKNRAIVKTVSHNNDTESHTVHITDWGLELDLFKSADINRPAWKNGYTVVDEYNTLIYKAKTPDLKVREIIIKKDKDKVKWILIYNKTKNILYQTTEKLSYFPDSLYLIEKDQRVKLMGNNHYVIQGQLGK